MAKFFKKLMSIVLGFFYHRGETALVQEKTNSAIIPSPVVLESSSELIKAVQDKMNEVSNFTLAAQVAGLEKAIYHLATRQADTLTELKATSEQLLVISTSLEEILHLIDGAYAEDQEDEAIMNEAWDGPSKQGKLLN